MLFLFLFCCNQKISILVYLDFTQFSGHVLAAPKPRPRNFQKFENLPLKRTKLTQNTLNINLKMWLKLEILSFFTPQIEI